MLRHLSRGANAQTKSPRSSDVEVMGSRSRDAAVWAMSVWCFLTATLRCVRLSSACRVGLYLGCVSRAASLCAGASYCRAVA